MRRRFRCVSSVLETRFPLSSVRRTRPLDEEDAGSGRDIVMPSIFTFLLFYFDCFYD